MRTQYFQEEKQRGLNYVEENPVANCALHHLNTEDVDTTRVQTCIKMCQGVDLGKGLTKYLMKKLVKLHIIYPYLNGTFALTRVGESIVEKTDEQNLHNHPAYIKVY